MRQWRLITEQRQSCRWNMAVDEALLRCFRPAADRPILRIYRWKPALSFGRAGPVRNVVDMHSVEERHLAFVRRMTGGGVLVHGDDLSYAMILPDTFAKTMGVKQSYRHLCGFLIKCYETLGLHAGFAAQQQIAAQSSAVCLAGTEAYDIMIGGAKIGGNAQRYGGGAVLQHGSVPLRIDRAFFEPFFLQDSGLEAAATLQNLGITLTWTELAERLIESFAQTFEATLRHDTLREDEYALARRLYEEKYTKEAWNLDGTL